MKIYGQGQFKISARNQALNPKSWCWKPVHKDWLLHPKQFQIKGAVQVFGSIDRKFTLVLSQNDVQTGALLKTLREQKKSYVFINWDKFALVGEVYLSKYINLIKYKKQIFDLKNVKSVYYSAPDLIEAQYDTSDYFSLSEKLYINRWAEVLRSLENVLEKVTWVPAKPSQLISLSQKKYNELLMAQKLGLDTPQTIFTSSPLQANIFLKQNKKILLREFGRRVFIDKKNKFRQLENKIIENHKDLQLVQNTPCVFQNYIEKKFEVRAVVVANKVLSCKIDSQIIDWRNNEGKTPFSKFTLPVQVQKKLIKLQKQLGFNLSCFDLICGVDNKYYFLEMNRPGSWFFIEALTGLKIRDAIVKRL